MSHLPPETTQPADPWRCVFPWLARRDMLKVGSLALSGSLLPGAAMATRAAAGESPAGDPTAGSRVKSVVFLWMAGGVTHHDSLDPKPTAPEEVRGTLSAIDTTLPGVQFAETCPNLAKIAHKLALVRNYSHDNNDHFMSQAWALSGRKVPLNQILTEPNIGAIVSYIEGPRNNIPAYLAVPGWTFPGPPPTNLFVGGWLGEQYAPLHVGGEPEERDFTKTSGRVDYPPDVDERIRPAALAFLEGLDAPRLVSRGGLRTALECAAIESAKGQAESSVDGMYDDALRLLQSQSVRGAFQLDKEPDAIREAYGRTKIGNRCLTAARLVEAGARFVMVDYGYDPHYGNLWDNHNVPEQRFPHISEMAKRPYHVAGIDRAFAGLINDLESRGLLDSTLVVFATEFGRTPKINPGGGRDHWGMAGSIFFAGGGARVGQVIGGTDRQGAWPTTRGYSPSDVAATIYHFLGIAPHRVLQDRQGRPMLVLPEGEAISEII